MNPHAPIAWQLRVLTRRDAAAVTALRQAAYAQAREFLWRDPATLGWTAADDAGTVLGLLDEHSGRLLASVRLNVIGSAARAEAFLEHGLVGLPLAWPALVLSRAATLPGLQARGLMARLRLSYLERCAASHGSERLRGVLALVYRDASRVRSMQQAGFELHAPSASHDTEAVALAAPLLAWLPRQRLAAALVEARAQVARPTVPAACLEPAA